MPLSRAIRDARWCRITRMGNNSSSSDDFSQSDESEENGEDGKEVDMTTKSSESGDDDDDDDAADRNEMTTLGNGRRSEKSTAWEVDLSDWKPKRTETEPSEPIEERGSSISTSASLPVTITPKTMAERRVMDQRRW